MLSEFETRPLTEYRLVCQGTWEPDEIGCSGLGPRALSANEAMELARKKGWKKIDYRWVCPAHARAWEGR